MSRLQIRVAALESVTRPADVAVHAAAHLMASLSALNAFAPLPPLPDGVTEADVRNAFVGGLRQLETRTCAA